MNMDYTLKPIGWVRSEIRERKAMPSFGAPAAVELMPEFEEGLLRIEKHSHLWVLAWLMARPEREVLQVTPRGVDPASADAMHGVFSVRSPARPNPIGLTAAEVLGRDGLTLRFDRLDFLDGTPVIDLKPYFVSRDLIYAANNIQVGRPKNREALRDSLLSQALRFQPVRHPDLALAVRVLEHWRVVVCDWKERQPRNIALPAARPFLIDAVLGIQRCTFGGGMTLEGRDEVRLGGDSYRLKGGLRERGFDAVLAAQDEELFSYSRSTD